MSRKAPVLVAAIAILLASAPGAWACQSCMGAEDSPLVAGAQTGALALVAVVFAVQAAFVGFFVYLRRRARLVSNIDLDAEWSDIQNQRGSE